MDPEDPEKKQLVCTDGQAGPSHWEEFTPEVSVKSRNALYRFRCPRSGLFHCALTGLVFVVNQKTELQYSMKHWDEDQVEAAGKIPAGPLFRIECPKNAICKIHFPHCETKNGQYCGKLSIAQINDDGITFLNPLEVTDTHAIIEVSDILDMSAFGLVWSFQQWLSSKTVCGQVLLFIAPPNVEIKRKKLNVILVPFNIPVDEVQLQQWHATRLIKAPSVCELDRDQSYSVACPNACIIQPKKSTFFPGFGPNFHPTFEIRLPSKMQQATVTVKDLKNKEVWTQDVDLTDPALKNVSLEDRLLSIRPEFSACVSIPVLDELLEELLQQRYINDAECEEAKTKGRTDQASYLIDLVRCKGPGACSFLIKRFCEMDPYLSEKLNLW